MRRYLFGQIKYERNLYCEVYLAEAGKMVYICTLPIAFLSRATDIVADILETLTQRFGKVKVRPARLEDIPLQLRRYFVSMDDDDDHNLFAINPLWLEEDYEESRAYAERVG